MSLSGPWTGAYFYPGWPEPTPFSLNLVEAGAAIHGMIEEPDSHDHFGVPVVYATFAGSHEEGVVDFVKTYEEGGPGVYPIRYSGVLSPDGTRIDGDWIIPGHGYGAFYMIRAARPQAGALGRTTEVKA